MIYSSDVVTTKGRPVRFGPLVRIYEWHVVKISLICTFNHNQQNYFDFSHFHLQTIIKMKKLRFRYLKDPQTSIYSHRCQTWCLIGGIIRYNFKSTYSKDNLCQVLFQIMDCIRKDFQLMAMHIRYGLLSDPVLMKIIIVQHISSLGKTRLKSAERNFVSNLETTLKSKLGHFSSCACS